MAPVNDPEWNQSAQLGLLAAAREEILGLRRRLAHAYDVLSTVVGFIPRPSQGYGMDVAWQIEQLLKSQQEREAEPEPAG